MRVYFVVIIFLLAQSPSLAQDDLYYGKPKQSDSVVVMQDLQYVQYCLGKYYKERQSAFMLLGLSIVMSSGAVIASNQNPDLADKIFIGSAISGLTSIIIFYDSEKWLKRGSVTISASGIKVTF